MILIFLMQGTEFLRFFTEDVDASNWEDIAYSWAITAFVVSVIFVGLTFAYKYFRKSTAAHHEKKIWSRGQTWLSFFVGLFPLFLTLLVIWYLTTDYYEIVKVGGLVKGALFAWIVYLLLMVTGHLVSPWRRELI